MYVDFRDIALETAITLLEATDDISKSRSIESVMVRGQWFPQAELDGLVDQYVATH